MIKKGYLLSLVVVCSLFFLTACPKAQGSDEVELFTFKDQKMPFDTLVSTGFVPPVIRLPDSYVNDKIESKAKKLSYEFYYYVLIGDETFDQVTRDKLFSPTYIIHTATIAEEDAGDASKTKIKYDRLKGANGGDICVGTKFALGLRVKDQSDKLVYHAIMQYVVHAPKAFAATTSGRVCVHGDQMGYKGEVESSEGTVTRSATEYKDDITIYAIANATGKVVSLKYGEFGETNKVLVK